MPEIASFREEIWTNVKRWKRKKERKCDGRLPRGNEIMYNLCDEGTEAKLNWRCQKSDKRKGRQGFNSTSVRRRSHWMLSAAVYTQHLHYIFKIQLSVNFTYVESLRDRQTDRAWGWEREWERVWVWSEKWRGLCLRRLDWDLQIVFHPLHIRRCNYHEDL